MDTISCKNRLKVMTMLNICKLTILDALSVKQAYSKCPF